MAPHRGLRGTLGQLLVRQLRHEPAHHAHSQVGRARQALMGLAAGREGGQYVQWQTSNNSQLEAALAHGTMVGLVERKWVGRVDGKDRWLIPKAKSLCTRTWWACGSLAQPRPPCFPPQYLHLRQMLALKCCASRAAARWHRAAFAAAVWTSHARLTPCSADASGGRWAGQPMSKQPSCLEVRMWQSGCLLYAEDAYYLRLSCARYSLW